MLFRFLKRINANAGLFNGHYIDVRSFYVAKFNAIPCITFIGDMDVTKVFAFIKKTYNQDIMATYQHSYFNHDDGNFYFNNTIIVLSYNRMVELVDNHCQVLHAADQYAWARQFIVDISKFRTEAVVAAFKHTHVVGFARETEMN
jgi:hypothetical protein